MGDISIPELLQGNMSRRHELKMLQFASILSLTILLICIFANVISAAFSPPNLDACPIHPVMASSYEPSDFPQYIIILKKALTASQNPRMLKHTVRCFLYKGLWQCIDADETSIELRSMHPSIWAQLGEAMEMSVREVAQDVSGRFESQQVQERVAEQTINDMIMLFIPSSKVLHAREILSSNNSNVTLALPSYKVRGKGKKLLVMQDGTPVTSKHEAFLMTKLATCAWGKRSKDCASRGFIVQLTDDDECTPRPFDKTRLLTIFQRFLNKKYITLTHK
jgi:hypothetical protein